MLLSSQTTLRLNNYEQPRQVAQAWNKSYVIRVYQGSKEKIVHLNKLGEELFQHLIDIEDNWCNCGFVMISDRELAYCLPKKSKLVLINLETQSQRDISHEFKSDNGFVNDIYFFSASQYLCVTEQDMTNRRLSYYQLDKSDPFLVEQLQVKGYNFCPANCESMFCWISRDFRNNIDFLCWWDTRIGTSAKSVHRIQLKLPDSHYEVIYQWQASEQVFCVVTRSIHSNENKNYLVDARTGDVVPAPCSFTTTCFNKSMYNCKGYFLRENIMLVCRCKNSSENTLNQVIYLNATTATPFARQQFQQFKHISSSLGGWCVALCQYLVGDNDNMLQIQRHLVLDKIEYYMHSDIKTIFLHFLLGLYDFDEDLLKDVVELIANEQMEIMAEEIFNISHICNEYVPYLAHVDLSCDLVRRAIELPRTWVFPIYCCNTAFIQRQINRQGSSTFSDSYDAILGVKVVASTHCLLVAEEAVQVAVLGPHKFFEIKKVKWIPIVPILDYQTAYDTLAPYFYEMDRLFDLGHHYYAKDYDLSLPYPLNKVRPFDRSERLYYDQFVWNAHIITFVPNKSESDILQRWCIKMIQGYIAVFEAELADGVVRYCLITRRSTKRAGTRFYSRGIDDQGHVANFAETEQLIFFLDFVAVHLQLRGSVPIFFQQLGVNGIVSGLNIERSQQFTQQAFNKHFKQLQTVYKRVLCINLLSDKKSEEKQLTLFFESLVSTTPKLSFMRYQFFDFHQECRGDKFENTSFLLAKIEAVLNSFDVTCINISNGLPLGQQRGIIRTNCLDCLDRTNYTQSRIALAILKRTLMRLCPPDSMETLLEAFEAERVQSQLIRKFNEVWAQNGDSVSILYTGIGSTHTDITRTGKRTLVGSVNHKLRSVMRFYNQFTDYDKHMAINEYLSNTTWKFSNMNTRNTCFVNTRIFSFKVSPTDNKSQVSARENLLRAAVLNKPPLFVINVFCEKSLSWLDSARRKLIGGRQQVITDAQKASDKVLSEHGYLKITGAQNEFTSLQVYCCASFVQSITLIKQDNLSTQLKREEEVVLAKFNLFDTSVIFSGINCQQYSTFLNVLDETHDKAFAVQSLGRCKSSSMLEQNYRFVIGNIGSHSSLSDDELLLAQKDIEKLKRKGDELGLTHLINKLLDCDDFGNGASNAGSCYIRNYSEGPLAFVPTQNRIIFWNKEGLTVKVLDYTQHSLTSLAALFSLQVCIG